MKKFFLLPDHLFEVFQNSLDGNLNANVFPKSLNKSLSVQEKTHYLLNDKKIDDSIKDELYNQNLNSMLRHKRKINSNPISIKMADDDEDDFENINYISNKGAVITNDDDYDNLSIASYTTPPATPAVLATPRAPKRKSNSTKNAMTRLERNPLTKDRISTLVKESKTPRLTYGRTIKVDKDKEQEYIAKAAENIFRTLRKQGDVYRIAHDGRIMDASRKRILGKSRPGDVQFIIRQILGEKFNPYIPPGYEQFKKTLLSNQTSRDLLKVAKVQTGGGWITTNTLDKRKWITGNRKDLQRKPQNHKLAQKPKHKNQKGNIRRDKSLQRETNSFQIQKWKI